MIVLKSLLTIFKVFLILIALSLLVFLTTELFLIISPTSTFFSAIKGFYTPLIDSLLGV